jgi:tRNA pseudouridine55 synthase
VSRPESTYDGLLIIDKPGRPSPCQPTSHDIVASVRSWSGQRRIGHTGTLDPMASGVLALCLGRVTRLVEYYQGHDKQYWAEIRLGTATDTYDATGTVTETRPVPDTDRSHLERVLGEFRGEITQAPPAYSAIKQEGEALYRKARRGEAVHATPRQVYIRQLDLLEFVSGNTIRLRVVCSAGVYIRSLAHDLGIALGGCAHLAALRREAAGPFTLEQAYRLEDVKEAAQKDRLDALLLPRGTGLDMPRLHPDDESLIRLGHGQKVVLPDVSSSHSGATSAGWQAGQLAQAIAPDGCLAGIIRCFGPADLQENSAIWKAEKWLQAS